LGLVLYDRKGFYGVDAAVDPVLLELDST